MSQDVSFFYWDIVIWSKQATQGMSVCEHVVSCVIQRMSNGGHVGLHMWKISVFPFSCFPLYFKTALISPLLKDTKSHKVFYYKSIFLFNTISQFVKVSVARQNSSHFGENSSVVSGFKKRAYPLSTSWIGWLSTLLVASLKTIR